MESQQDLWNTTDVRRVRWNQRNESKILMNSTSSFPKKNKRAGSALYGLRCPVLSVGYDSCRNDFRLSAAQSGTGVERSLYTGNYQQAYNRLHKTIISRSLPPVYVRLCVRRHVPVDTGEIRYLSGTMSMESLRRHTKKGMPDHIFQRFVPEESCHHRFRSFRTGSSRSAEPERT